MLEFVECNLAAFDVKANVMGLDEFLDGVSQLTAAPVFQTMHRAAIAGNNALIAFDHGRHLLALIGMHNKHYFVVTHKLHSLRISFDALNWLPKGIARL